MATASREFQVLVKPIGAVCNLDCSYCYYLGKRDLYPGARSFRMPEDLLESYIAQHIEACPIETVLFSWHGGEPTVLGLDYFRRIVELQRRHRQAGKTIVNGIQTNGTLLDEDWCRFLAAERFHVGISIDGPRELHDRYRLFKGERATHKPVVQAHRMLTRHRVDCDVLCVVHNLNVRHPQAVYRFFKELGVPYLQFLPLVADRGEGKASAETVPADAYGEFLCAIFREWVRHDMDRICIQNFEEASRPFLGAQHALCIVRQTCGDVVVLEHNGDCYACDHFVERRHLLGNLRETPLLEMLESPALREFGERKRDALPRTCRECEVLDLCNGGCPKDRFIRTPGGEPGLHYLCAGLKRFYATSKPTLQRLALAQRSGQSLQAFMRQLRDEEAFAPGQAGRNDPCPCGSGRKYKKCCLQKQPA